MANRKSLLSDRSAMFYVEMIAALLALGNGIYYLIQSRIDKCFDSLYFVFLVLGIVLAAAQLFLRFAFLVPLTGVCFGVAFGRMLYDMLPTMSDVWNGVDFIGGNLTAYLIYTILTLLAAILTTIVCFKGTEKEG